MDSVVMEKSCGAVLYTLIDGIRHYVLVSTSKGYNCGLPKGHMEGDENEKETALREVFEETGIHGELLDGFRKRIEYPLPGGIKEIIFFIAQYKNQ